MTIDKLPCPAKQNETVLKVNEIIDGKQDVLVSGTNIKTVNNISLLDSGNIDTNDIFIAEYDDNSYSDITNALTSGKAVFLRKGDDTVPSNTLYYPLSYIDDSNSTYYFSMIGDDTTNVVSVDNTSSWSYSSTDLQAKLISGTSIKTINNESLLGSGNINISSGGTVDQTYDPTSTNAQSGVAIAGAGFLTGITSSDIVTALTYTPYDASNPDGFITSAALSGYATESWVGQQGFLTSSDLTNYVTTDTAQNITGVKTYVGQKMIAFKQAASGNKLGFTLYNNNNVEKGYLEFNPTNTIDGAPLMTLGNYATAAAGITHVGFRKYSSVSGASGAYNLLAPLISDARTPFNLTTTYTNFYLPLGFTNGTNTVLTAKTGVVDISSLLPSLADYVTNSALTTTLADYQPLLISGTNIKTINNTSLLGSGDIAVGTVTSVNDTQPDSNGNVSISIPSITNLANKDLSNLSATGEAKFQAPLGYTPVNKAGDTMTGGLWVETSIPAIDLKDTIEVAGTTPSSERLKAVLFRDKNNKAVGRVQNIYLTTGARRTMLNCTDASGNNSENIYIGYDSNGNVETYAPTPSNGDNSTKIATTAFVNTVSANKVDKSGDTMTGGLTVEDGINIKYAGNKYFIVQNTAANYTNTIAPSSSVGLGGLLVQDVNGNNFGGSTLTHSTSNNVINVIYARRSIGGEEKNAYLTIGVDSSGNPYATAPATPPLSSNSTNIATTEWVNSKISKESGWTISYSQLVNTATTISASTTLTYSLASYLPSDNYIYEVMYSVKGTTGSTSGNEAEIAVGSGLIDVATHRVAGAQTRTSNAVSWAASGIMLIGNTTGGSAMRAIYIRQIANSSCTLNYFRVYAYRKLNYAL